MKTFLLFITAFLAINMYSQNKIESSLEESFSNATWQNSGGTNYQYDANNNLTSETDLDWNQGVWVASGRVIYTYNANNKVITQTRQFWDTTANQFNNSDRTTYTYDLSGKLITELYQHWTANVWVNSRKTDFTYNGNLIVTLTNPKWVGSQWVNNYRSTTTYSGIYLTQLLSEKWNGTIWINENRIVLTYNTNNKIINNNEVFWNGTAWMEDDNINYVLAVNGNRTSEIYKDLGVNFNKIDYTYDAAAQMSSFAHPFKDKTGVDYTFENFPYVNKILNALIYDYNTSTAAYALSSRTTYNYQSQIVLNTKSFVNKTVKIYPNPTSSILNIDIESQIDEVKIFDISGRTTTIKNANNKAINVSGLAKGIYFVEVKTNEGLFREKFIKN